MLYDDAYELIWVNHSIIWYVLKLIYWLKSPYGYNLA